MSASNPDASRRARRHRLAAVVVALVVIVVAFAAAAVGGAHPSPRAATTTAAKTTTTAASATTTTLPMEQAAAGWSVASRSRRGVMVDFRNLNVGGAIFRVVRLRARTTLLRWHVGAGDPLAWRSVPVDAGAAIDWSNEGPPGVVAVFNGGFKQGADAGGSVVDHVTLVPLVRGDATVAIDAFGHWEMGVWGQVGFPTAGFDTVSLRQNLVLMVQHSVVTSAVTTGLFARWGATIGDVAAVARSGLGVDARGNLLYVATMTPVTAIVLARALVAAGAVTAMQLDINPYWPILGVAIPPQHAAGSFAVQLPGSLHSATIYDTGWQRDFFVAMAEPNAWGCAWRSRGVNPHVAGAQAQRLVEVGPGCPVRPVAPAP